MKIIYSHLKTWLPDLTVTPKQLRDDITMLGHFASGYQEIDGEVILDLEIRQNRADCLGYYGIALDLSIFYDIPIILPETKSFTPCPVKGKGLGVRVLSPDVHRIQATKINNIKNSVSPKWLIKFLNLHDINSVNTLVDLTNYIMLQWGIPCHAFDTAKVSALNWENNQNFSDFTTFDGTKLKLLPNNLLISDGNKPVSLSFIGGQNSGIELNTTETIIEMAVYNRTRVRNDSRALKTITEASIRLDKGLDTETIPLAFANLISLISENCQGSVNSELFDFYPTKPDKKEIEFDHTLPSIYSGINIPVEFSQKIVDQVLPLTIRKDIAITEDLIEEVIRFYGYNKIPVDTPISSDVLSNVTPKILYLIEKIKDDLVADGYDEVRSWPLVNKPLSKNAIYTKNSINSEFPVLRESMIQSLKNQLDQYNRYKLPNPKFFEIGKIFYKEGDKYIEKYALGKYDGQNFSETILDDLEKPDNYIPQSINNSAIELTSQIITLDANVNSTESAEKLLSHYQSTLPSEILWSIEITDHYQNKYTFRVCYYNTDDKTAKKIHLSAFNLSTEKYTYIDPKTPTVLAYYANMYQTEIDATIIDIRSNNIILDKTIFFPEGGGQPSDIGTINNIPVTKLQYKDEQVIHQIENNQFSIGDKVKLKIDWDSRLKYMKIHSAGHLLHEVLTEIYPTIIPQKGYHHDEAYLIYQGQIESKDINKIESQFNKNVEENLSILCDYTDIETLTKDARSIPKNLPLHKKLRRLKIGDYPSMADGGIQVKTTQEIGKIKISSIDNNDIQVTIHYNLI